MISPPRSTGPLFASLLVLALSCSIGASAQGLGQSFSHGQDSRRSESASSGMAERTAQESPFLGGVPSGKAISQVLSLSLLDAIHRGLQQNLGLQLAQQAGVAARGARWRALSELLPQVSARTAESIQQINLKAFGFQQISGPSVVGPFSVFDTRASLSQPIFDLQALEDTRSATAARDAADYSYQDAREIVVLVVADLYLQAVAAQSRVAAGQAEVTTAEAVYRQSRHMKDAGVVAGIDVLRAQVELQSRQQRLIALRNLQARQKLLLARAIGLPIGQRFELADSVPYAPAPPTTLESSLARAYHERADYRRAAALLESAERARKAAAAERYPALSFQGDYGLIGRTPGESHGTFTAAAALEIPLFQGGRIHGKVLQADALVEQRRAEMEDLRSRIDFEVRTALMDLESAAEQVQVASSAVDLAEQQMQQARDRYQAGVSDSLEVVQAQQAVADAHENYITAVYQHNIAKAMLAKAAGIAETAVTQFLKGQP